MTEATGFDDTGSRVVIGFGLAALSCCLKVKLRQRLDADRVARLVELAALIQPVDPAARHAAEVLSIWWRHDPEEAIAPLRQWLDDFAPYLSDTARRIAEEWGHLTPPEEPQLHDWQRRADLA
jgi:hypothetical protein